MNHALKAFKTFANGVHKLSNACVWVAGILLVLLAVLIFVEVIARYVVKNSITGVQEICTMSIVVVLYLGLGYSTYQRAHVQVDVVINAFRPDVKMIDQGICSLLCILLSAPAAVQVFRQGLTFLDNGRTSQLMHIPYWPFYIVAAFGLLLTSVEFLLDGVRWFGEARAWRAGQKAAPAVGDGEKKEAE